MLSFVVLSLCLMSSRTSAESCPPAPSAPLADTSAFDISFKPTIGDRKFIFVSNFAENIQGSEVFLKDLSAVIEEAKNRDVLFQVMFNASSSLGIPSPNEIANNIVEAVFSTLASITPESLTKVLGSAVAVGLYYHGLLTSLEDATNLSKIYADELIEAVALAKTKSLPGEYIRAVIDGTVKFFSDFNIVSPSTVNEFLHYLAEEFYTVKVYA